MGTNEAQLARKVAIFEPRFIDIAELVTVIKFVKLNSLFLKMELINDQLQSISKKSTAGIIL